LRRLGHDVLTVSEAGKAEQAIQDDEVLAFATEQGRAVLTINRKHFIALHRSKPNHAGIIVCTLDADFVGQAKRIDAALREYPDATSQLIRVNRPPQ
jgi:predicted nuclease of predicted toxin-antitoxin system